MLDREEKKPVRSSAILQMLGQKEEQQVEDKLIEVKMTDEQFDNLSEKVSSSREKNPRAYERYRGTGGTKPMSYYLSDKLIQALALRAALEDKDKSEIVREALTKELSIELEEVERIKERLGR